MEIEIHLPDIGTDAADVTEILVSIDEQIEVDTPLISVEGDKAAMEIPSPKSGIVKEIKIAVGDSVSTGTLILMLNTSEDEPAKTECTTDQEEKESDKLDIVSKELHLPDVGTDEVTVTEIHVEVGDQVEDGLLRKTRTLKPLLEKAMMRGVKIRIIVPNGEIEGFSDNLELLEVKHDPSIAARFVIVDKKQVVFMLADDKKIHPSYDMGFWINSVFFCNAMSKMFNQSWNSQPEVPSESTALDSEE